MIQVSFEPMKLIDCQSGTQTILDERTRESPEPGVKDKSS